MDDYDPACPTEDDALQNLDLSQVPLPQSEPIPKLSSTSLPGKAADMPDQPKLETEEDERSGRKKKKKKKKSQGRTRSVAEVSEEEEVESQETAKRKSGKRGEEDSSTDSIASRTRHHREKEQTRESRGALSTPPTPSSSHVSGSAPLPTSPSSTTSAGTETKAAAGKGLLNLGAAQPAMKSKISFQFKRNLRSNALALSSEKNEEEDNEDDAKVGEKDSEGEKSMVEKSVAGEYVPTRFKVAKKHGMFRPSQGGPPSITVMFDTDSVAPSKFSIDMASLPVDLFSGVSRSKKTSSVTLAEVVTSENIKAPKVESINEPKDKLTEDVAHGIAVKDKLEGHVEIDSPPPGEKQEENVETVSEDMDVDKTIMDSVKRSEEDISKELESVCDEGIDNGENLKPDPEVEGKTDTEGSQSKRANEKLTKKEEKEEILSKNERINDKEEMDIEKDVTEGTEAKQASAKDRTSSDRRKGEEQRKLTSYEKEKNAKRDRNGSSRRDREDSEDAKKGRREKSGSDDDRSRRKGKERDSSEEDRLRTRSRRKNNNYDDRRYRRRDKDDSDDSRRRRSRDREDSYEERRGRRRNKDDSSDDGRKRKSLERDGGYEERRHKRHEEARKRRQELDDNRRSRGGNEKDSRVDSDDNRRDGKAKERDDSDDERKCRRAKERDGADDDERDQRAKKRDDDDDDRKWRRAKERDDSNKEERKRRDKEKDDIEDNRRDDAVKEKDESDDRRKGKTKGNVDDNVRKRRRGKDRVGSHDVKEESFKEKDEGDEKRDRYGRKGGDGDEDGESSSKKDMIKKQELERGREQKVKGKELGYNDDSEDVKHARARDSSDEKIRTIESANEGSDVDLKGSKRMEDAGLDEMRKSEVQIHRITLKENKAEGHNVDLNCEKEVKQKKDSKETIEAEVQLLRHENVPSSIVEKTKVPGKSVELSHTETSGHESSSRLHRKASSEIEGKDVESKKSKEIKKDVSSDRVWKNKGSEEVEKSDSEVLQIEEHAKGVESSRSEEGLEREKRKNNGEKTGAGKSNGGKTKDEFRPESVSKVLSTDLSSGSKKPKQAAIEEGSVNISMDANSSSSMLSGGGADNASHRSKRREVKHEKAEADVKIDKRGIKDFVSDNKYSTKDDNKHSAKKETERRKDEGIIRSRKHSSSSSSYSSSSSSSSDSDNEKETKDIVNTIQSTRHTDKSDKSWKKMKHGRFGEKETDKREKFPERKIQDRASRADSFDSRSRTERRRKTSRFSKVEENEPYSSSKSSSIGQSYDSEGSAMMAPEVLVDVTALPGKSKWEMDDEENEGVSDDKPWMEPVQGFNSNSSQLSGFGSMNQQVRVLPRPGPRYSQVVSRAALTLEGGAGRMLVESYDEEDTMEPEDRSRRETQGQKNDSREDQTREDSDWSKGSKKKSKEDKAEKKLKKKRKKNKDDLRSEKVADKKEKTSGRRGVSGKEQRKKAGTESKEKDEARQETETESQQPPASYDAGAEMDFSDDDLMKKSAKNKQEKEANAWSSDESDEEILVPSKDQDEGNRHSLSPSQEKAERKDDGIPQTVALGSDNAVEKSPGVIEQKAQKEHDEIALSSVPTLKKFSPSEERDEPKDRVKRKSHSPSESLTPSKVESSGQQRERPHSSAHRKESTSRSPSTSEVKQVEKSETSLTAKSFILKDSSPSPARSRSTETSESKKISASRADMSRAKERKSHTKRSSSQDRYASEEKSEEREKSSKSKSKRTERSRRKRSVSKDRSSRRDRRSCSQSKDKSPSRRERSESRFRRERSDSRSRRRNRTEKMRYRSHSRSPVRTRRRRSRSQESRKSRSISLSPGKRRRQGSEGDKSQSRSPDRTSKCSRRSSSRDRFGRVKTRRHSGSRSTSLESVVREKKRVSSFTSREVIVIESTDNEIKASQDKGMAVSSTDVLTADQDIESIPMPGEAVGVVETEPDVITVEEDVECQVTERKFSDSEDKLEEEPMEISEEEEIASDVGDEVQSEARGNQRAKEEKNEKQTNNLSQSKMVTSSRISQPNETRNKATEGLGMERQIKFSIIGPSKKLKLATAAGVLADEDDSDGEKSRSLGGQKKSISKGKALDLLDKEPIEVKEKNNTLSEDKISSVPSTRSDGKDKLQTLEASTPKRGIFKYIPLWEMEEKEHKPVMEPLAAPPLNQGLGLDYGSGSSDQEDEKSPIKRSSLSKQPLSDKPIQLDLTSGSKLKLGSQEVPSMVHSSESEMAKISGRNKCDKSPSVETENAVEKFSTQEEIPAKSLSRVRLAEEVKQVEESTLQEAYSPSHPSLEEEIDIYDEVQSESVAKSSDTNSKSPAPILSTPSSASLKVPQSEITGKLLGPAPPPVGLIPPPSSLPAGVGPLGVPRSMGPVPAPISFQLIAPVPPPLGLPTSIVPAPVGLPTLVAPVPAPVGLPTSLAPVPAPVGLPTSVAPVPAPVGLPTSVAPVPAPVGLPAAVAPVPAPVGLPTPLAPVPAPVGLPTSVAPVGLPTFVAPVPAPVGLPTSLAPVPAPVGLPAAVAPVPAPVGLPTSLAPIPAPVGLPTSVAPVRAPVGLSTSIAPVSAPTGLSTSKGPMPLPMGLSTSIAPVSAPMGLSTSIASVPAPIGLSTSIAPVPAPMGLSTLIAAVPVPIRLPTSGVPESVRIGVPTSIAPVLAPVGQPSSISPVFSLVGVPTSVSPMVFSTAPTTLSTSSGLLTSSSSYPTAPLVTPAAVSLPSLQQTSPASQSLKLRKNRFDELPSTIGVDATTSSMTNICPEAGKTLTKPGIIINSTSGVLKDKGKLGPSKRPRFSSILSQPKVDDSMEVQDGTQQGKKTAADLSTSKELPIFSQGASEEKQDLSSQGIRERVEDMPSQSEGELKRVKVSEESNSNTIKSDVMESESDTSSKVMQEISGTKQKEKVEPMETQVFKTSVDLHSRSDVDRAEPKSETEEVKFKNSGKIRPEAENVEWKNSEEKVKVDSKKDNHKSEKKFSSKDESPKQEDKVNRHHENKECPDPFHSKKSDLPSPYQQERQRKYPGDDAGLASSPVAVKNKSQKVEDNKEKSAAETESSMTFIDMASIPLPGMPLPPLPVDKSKSAPDSASSSTTDVSPLPSCPSPLPPMPAQTESSPSSKPQTLSSLLAEKKKRFSQSPLAIGLLPKVSAPPQSPLSAGPLPKFSPEEETKSASGLKLKLRAGSAAASGSKIQMVIKAKNVLQKRVAAGFDDDDNSNDEKLSEIPKAEHASDDEFHGSGSAVHLEAEEVEDTPPPPPPLPPPPTLPPTPPQNPPSLPKNVIAVELDKGSSERPVVSTSLAIEGLANKTSGSLLQSSQQRPKVVSLTDIEAFPVQVITSSRKEQDSDSEPWSELVSEKGNRERSRSRNEHSEKRKGDRRHRSREHSYERTSGRREEYSDKRKKSWDEEEEDRRSKDKKRKKSGDDTRSRDKSEADIGRKIKKEKIDDGYKDGRESKSKISRTEADKRKSQRDQDRDRSHSGRRERERGSEERRIKSHYRREELSSSRRRDRMEEEDRKRKRYSDEDTSDTDRRRRKTSRSRERDGRRTDSSRRRGSRGRSRSRSPAGRRVRYGRRGGKYSSSSSSGSSSSSSSSSHGSSAQTKRSSGSSKAAASSNSMEGKLTGGSQYQGDVMSSGTSTATNSSHQFQTSGLVETGSYPQVYQQPSLPGQAVPYPTHIAGVSEPGFYPAPSHSYPLASQPFQPNYWPEMPEPDLFSNHQQQHFHQQLQPPLQQHQQLPPDPYNFQTAQQPPYPPQESFYPDGDMVPPTEPHFPTTQPMSFNQQHPPPPMQDYQQDPIYAQETHLPFPLASHHNYQIDPHQIVDQQFLHEPLPDQTLSQVFQPQMQQHSPSNDSPHYRQHNNLVSVRASPILSSTVASSPKVSSSPLAKSLLMKTSTASARGDSPLARPRVSSSGQPSHSSPTTSARRTSSPQCKRAEEEPGFGFDIMATKEAWEKENRVRASSDSRSGKSKRNKSSAEVGEATVTSSGVEDSSCETFSDHNSGEAAVSLRPLKVKSRWRRNSEAEAKVSESLTSAGTESLNTELPVSLDNGSVGVSSTREARRTRSQAAAEAAAATEEDVSIASTGESSLVTSVHQQAKSDTDSAKVGPETEQASQAQNTDREEENDYHSIIRRHDFPKFEIITENIHLTERKKSKSMKRMQCDCTTSREDRSMGLEACGSDCLNRMLMIECGSRCPCGEHCTNRRFQKKQYANALPFKAGAKGWGLRAIEDMDKEGTFIMEYVGELLNYDEFVRRTHQYSKGGTRHHYFMALNADEVIDATLRGSISRFINHSCDPNCETQKWTVNGELRVGFFTRKEIKKGEELTFDYQFEHYGEAQKCYCGAANCRGFIGLVKPSSQAKQSSKKERKKKGGKDIFKDELLEEDIEKLSLLDGMRNKTHVLELCRLMVRAEKVQHRIAILKILQDTSEVACLRLFLDYHGLPLFWSWMADIGSADYSHETQELKMLMLSVLKSLPISNKTVLKESKILDIVERWTVAAVAAARKPPPPPPPTSTTTTSSAATSTIISTSAVADTSVTMDEDEEAPVQPPPETIPSSSSTTLSEIETDEPSLSSTSSAAPQTETAAASPSQSPPPQQFVLPGSSITPVSILSSATRASSTGKVKRRVTFAEGHEESQFSPEPYEEEAENDGISSSTNYSEEGEGAYLRHGLDISGEDEGASSGAADSTSQRLGAGEEEEGGETNQGSDNDASDMDCVIRDPLASLAAECMSQWSSLKEVFKIPKKERVEERKRTERELDVLSKKETKTSDPFAKWKRSRMMSTKFSKRKSSDDEERKTASPKMSKEQRRQLFEAQVKAEDEKLAQAAAEELQRQQELFMLHQQRMLEDPAYCYYHHQLQAAGINAQVDPHLSLPDLGLDPDTGMPLLPQELVIDPSTGQPVVDPNTGQPMLAPVVQPMEGGQAIADSNLSHEILLDPATGQPLIDPNTGQPMLASVIQQQQQQQSVMIDPSTRQPLIDPNTGQPLLDPNMGQPLLDPNTGHPLVDPNTGHPLVDPNTQAKPLLDPSTGQQLLDPNTGQPLMEYYHSASQSDPDTAQPPQACQPLGQFQVDSMAEASLQHHQLTQVPGISESDLMEEEVPPPPSPPSNPVSKLPPNWKTAKDAEGRIYYYHAFTRQTQWDLPSWDENEGDSDDMDLDGMEPEEYIKHQSSKSKATTTMAETSGEVARKIKDHFRSKMSGFIVLCLNPYRKSDCKTGRITSTDDFKHLARKLTHHVMSKELKHCKHVEDLEVNENVKSKAKDYVRKYMGKFGSTYKKTASPDSGF